MHLLLSRHSWMRLALATFFLAWIDPAEAAQPYRLRALPGEGLRAEGSKVRTAIPTDLAIQGAGAFLVRHPVTGMRELTRAGFFLVDRDGYLITYDRWRLQGWSDASLTVVGDVRIDGQQRPSLADSEAVLVTYGFRGNGLVEVRLSDGTTYIRGQVRRYQLPSHLASVPSPEGRYSIGEGVPLIAMDKDEMWLESGALERVHVTETLVDKRQRFHFELQGAFQFTGAPLDLAISGAGYFLVRDPVRQESVAVRSAHFQRDGLGYLVDEAGRRVQGISNVITSAVGDLRIDTEGRPVEADPAAEMGEFTIERDGRIQIRLSDGFEFTRGRILLQLFAEPFSLVMEPDGTFGHLAAAVPLDLAWPGNGGTGSVYSQVRELPFDQVQIRALHPGGFRVLITGELGARGVLERSIDWIRWEPVEGFTLTPDGVEVSDPWLSSSGAMFYRVLGIASSLR